MNEQHEKALHYRTRAEAFLRAMNLCTDRQILQSDLPRYLPAASLLAVHAAISLCDAVLVLRTGKRSTAQNHEEAGDRLGTACRASSLDETGVKHFVWLVGRKDNFAYGDRRISESDLQLSVLKAQRFCAWVYRSFKELAPEESDDAN